MSTVTFRHERNESYKLKGVKHTIKESIIDGEKGLSFMFLKKVGEDDFYKVYAQEKEGGKFTVQEKKNDKETESEMSEADVKKMIKGNKDFAFVATWWDEKRGSYKGKAKVMKGGNPSTQNENSQENQNNENNQYSYPEQSNNI
jgi:hypothetical protein